MGEPTSPDDTATVAGAQAVHHRGSPSLRLAGRYELFDPLGRGTSKSVYRARDTLLNRDVAVALIHDPVLRGALNASALREARTQAGLDDHPNIVAIHDIDDDPRQRQTFIVSQLVRGGSLADRLLGSRPLAVPEAVRIAHQVAIALSHAHRHGVVHRDVKPGNILLAEDGTALLADFGIALLFDQSRQTSHPVGTPAYMAPEQARPPEDIGPAADLHALGATLFEMVCGEPPFIGENAVRRARGTPPPDPRRFAPDLPEPLADLIVRMLAVRPADRPPSADAVRDELARVLAAGPLPAALDAEAARPFAGRREPLAILRDGWRQAGDGQLNLCLVAGEPGIGKTRLAAFFATEAQTGGGVVLYGRCDSEPLVSYQPFVEALRVLMTQRPGLARRLPQFELELAELSRLVPELRGPSGRPRTGSGHTERYLLFEAIAGLIVAAAEDTPVLLVLDDLHWADKPTALLLKQLLRHRGRVMILGTTRPVEGVVRLGGADPPLRELLTDLEREPGDPSVLHRLTLTGLDADETRALVHARHAGRDEGFVRRLQARTGGNPFFIEVILRDMPDDEAMALAGIPTVAKEFIARRVRALDPAALEVLTDAAVCGPEFRLDVLAELHGTSAHEIEPLVAAGVTAGLVAERVDDRYAFRHAIVRDALYDAKLPKEKLRCHLRIGEALERLELEPPALAELAHHFYVAADYEPAKAIRYARAAAERAAAALAYEEAAGHLANADRVLTRQLDASHRLERWEILHQLGRLLWQMGARDEARGKFAEAVRLARELGDRLRFARSVLGYAGRWYDAEHSDPELVALLEEALAQLPAGERATRAKLMAALADALQFTASRERADALTREAVQIAQGAGDWALVRVMGGRHNALLHIEHLVDRLALSAQWTEHARAAGHREGESLALTWRIYDLMEFGDRDGARALHERLETLAGALRQPLYRAFAASWATNWHAIAGEFDAAAQKARECHELSCQAQGTFAASLFAGQFFGLYRDTGRLTELPPLMEELREDRSLPVWRAGFVLIHLAAGDVAAARREFRALTRDGFTAVPRDGFWLPAMCVLAEACAALGDLDAAARLARELEPYASRNAQIGLAVFLGPVGGFLGPLAAMLGRAEQAKRYFEGALDRSAAMGAHVIEARIQQAYGELLQSGAGARERARGRALLDRAQATRARLGLVGPGAGGPRGSA